jgi:hypothetical protein
MNVIYDEYNRLLGEIFYMYNKKSSSRRLKIKISNGRSTRKDTIHGRDIGK